MGPQCVLSVPSQNHALLPAPPAPRTHRRLRGDRVPGVRPRDAALRVGLPDDPCDKRHDVAICVLLYFYACSYLYFYFACICIFVFVCRQLIHQGADQMAAYLAENYCPTLEQHAEDCPDTLVYPRLYTLR